MSIERIDEAEHGVIFIGPGGRVKRATGRAQLWLRDRRLVIRWEPENGEAFPPPAPLPLTPREAEVLAWVAEGKSNAVVAAILGISPRTVKKHLEHVYTKLGVETRTAAAMTTYADRRIDAAYTSSVGSTHSSNGTT